MRFILVFIYVFLFKIWSLAQTFVGGVGVTNTTINPREIISDQGSIIGFLSKLKPTNVEVEGDPYIYDDWRKSRILLKSEQRLDNFLIKIDLVKNEIDVQTEKGVRVLDANKVFYFEIFHKDDTVVYLNADRYAFRDTKLYGFFEVVCTGQWNLLLKFEVSILPPNYNIQTNVGSKNAKLVKTPRYYIIRDTSSEAYLVNSFKDIVSMLDNEDSLQAERVIKDQKLKFKNKDHLTKLFSEINN